MATNNAYGDNIPARQRDQQNLDPWCVQGTLFIPVIPTDSANLAGTASITAEYFIGQAVSFLGAGRDEENPPTLLSALKARIPPFYDPKLTNQFGGYLQGQYWFNNQWYLIPLQLHRGNLTPTRGQEASSHFGYQPAGLRRGTSGSSAASTGNDQLKLWSEYNLTLWYRPVEALKNPV